jgi:hypothetical protein
MDIFTRSNSHSHSNTRNHTKPSIVSRKCITINAEKTARCNRFYERILRAYESYDEQLEHLAILGGQHSPKYISDISRTENERFFIAYMLSIAYKYNIITSYMTSVKLSEFNTSRDILKFIKSSDVYSTLLAKLQTAEAAIYIAKLEYQMELEKSKIHFK